MADDATAPPTAPAVPPATAATGVGPAADPAGTQGAAQPAEASVVVVPDDVKQKFPDLIELILRSESMNDEERQYWINILPIMTDDQIQNLRQILTNERDQLAAIDAKYSKEIEQIGQEEFLQKVSEERKKGSENRTQAEESAKAEEGKS